MNKQASAVFWIGLLLIFANFWITGQSTILWQSFAGVLPGGAIQPRGNKRSVPPKSNKKQNIPAGGPPYIPPPVMP